MKPDKKQEADVLQVYDAWWHSYLTGDVKTYDSLLDDEYRFVGSTNGEEFLNRKDTTKFFELTADQLAGKAELRNLTRTIEKLDSGHILITDLADAYVTSESEWVFYSRFRFTSLMKETKNGWRFIYQHFSAPDTKAQEGETLGTEQITKENQELRDAIKRRTVELENKTRALEIEASLERVRTVAMGMYKPDDMLDICRIISQQLALLNVKEIRNVQTAIIYEAKGSYLNFEYYAKHEKTFITDVDFKLHPTQFEFVNRMLKGPEEFFSKHFTGKEVQNWYTYQQTTNQFADSYLATATSLNYYWYSMGPVALGISTYVPLTEEDIVLFKRFRNVFELAYRRFMDIEQAAAQAREAQIELALERVRARTMAMQYSDELQDAAILLFQQVKTLGVETGSCGFNIWTQDGKAATVWMSSAEGKLQTPFTLPHTESAIYKQAYEAMKKGENFLVKEVDGKNLKKHFDYLLTIPGIGEVIKKLRETGYSFPEKMVYHFAFFNQGYLSFHLQEHRPSTHDIFKRFAKVFEQTYTRFLDLQKAEAQAREAQIELGLERVRARTMAMQKSEELNEVATILFNQLRSLGGHLWTCAIVLCKQNSDEDEFRTAFEGGLQPSVFVSNNEDVMHIKMYEGWKNHLELFSMSKEGEELKEHYAYMMTVPSIKPTFEKMLASGINFPLWQKWHAAYFNAGYLLIITTEPYKEEHIFVRFAKVFDQAYTRFLDLQKAEAQAREAQIEAALERVRSKTMAMHNSREVGETVAAMFEELVKLGVDKSIRCGIGILNDTRYMEVWTASTNKNGETTLDIGLLDMTIHPLLAGAKEAWKNKKTDFTYELLGEDLRNYFKAINAAPDYPVQVDLETLPDKIMHTDFFFSEGLLFAFSPTSIPEERAQVLKRFAGVFGQTYRRYLDLKNAEAQVREAQIETALEKVRSRTLAMQKSDELAETASVLFQQLITLGIEPNRLYITIIHSESDEADFWITNEDGSKLTDAYSANLGENNTFQKMYDGWKKQLQHLVIDMQGEELQNYFHYLQSRNVPFKGGLEQTRRVQHLAYFSKGFIGMASPDEQPAETLQLLERFAAVFNLTFTRFNDLKIAEAHALQAEQDLVAIKEAKQKAEEALTELQVTQKQLIQSEKMASLGELTAGIAHEIQNPLNFVNNFSEVSKELLDEMKEAIEKGDTEDAKEIMNAVIRNLEKINHHGKRADGIVKGMLQHSRSSSGQQEATDINALADEYLRLSYHGLRAKDKSFNATLKTDFDSSIGLINIIPQDMGRVILNLITNAFYACTERSRSVVNEKAKAEGGKQNTSASSAGQPYEPTVEVSTKKVKDKVEVMVKDNGNGIPQKLLDKIFQPFFTTKPTGEGTGLGLSLSYDIVKAHGGEIKVNTKENEGTTFIIQLLINTNKG